MGNAKSFVVVAASEFTAHALSNAPISFDGSYLLANVIAKVASQPTPYIRFTSLVKKPPDVSFKSSASITSPLVSSAFRYAALK